MQGLNVFEKGIGYLEACLGYYVDSCAYLMLYLIMLIYLCVCGSRRDKNIFIPASVFLILTVYNPVAPVVLDHFFDVNSEYYRFFWITPVIVLVPYVFTKLIILAKNKNQLVITTIILILICVLGGKFLYKDGIRIAENIYKMPTELIQISEIIHEDSNVKYPKAFFEYEYNMQMRQYDPKMLLTVNREDYLYAVSSQYTEDMLYDADNPQYRILATLVKNQEIPEEAFLDALERTKTEYVVVNKNHIKKSYLLMAGLEKIDETDNHIIFKYDVKEPYVFELVDYSAVY